VGKNPTGAWDWSFAWQILPELLQATGYTIFATLVSFVGALFIGLSLALIRNSRIQTVSRITGAIVEFIRSTPILIQIYFLYFILPTIGIALPALAVGIIALSLHYGAYVSESYRAGIASVATGQRDAAKALGVSSFALYYKVVLPQALPPIIPSLGNHLIALFKETPLLSAIAIIELIQTAKLIGSDTFRYNEPITLAGLILLSLSLLAARLITEIESHAWRWRG
jgi:polar amino acid transport system permease protein